MQDDDSQRFQFHKGTIRTKTLARGLDCRFNFNSIKVRLEHYIEKEQKQTEREFQFHKGTIRTVSICAG